MSSRVYDTLVVVGVVSEVIGTHGSGTVKTKSLVLTAAPIVILNWIVYIPMSASTNGDIVTRPEEGFSVTMLGFAMIGEEDTIYIVAY